MKEIDSILEKYIQFSIPSIENEIELNTIAINYSKDLTELVDILSRINNFQARPNYYNLNEATIVGSMTRIIKLFKEFVNNYEQNKLEILTLFARPLYESFITLKYLIKNGEQSQRNFRLVSYRARFENFKILIKEDPNHPIIKRQLWKLNSKLKEDGFTMEDLEAENGKSQKWKLDGKSFWKIHSEVDFAPLYSFIYGVGSDAIHGNWQEIFDFHLTKKDNGYFGFLYYEKCDCRVLIPMNTIITESILEFLEWNECLTEKISVGIENMQKANQSFYQVWEERFGEKVD